ncbi:uncharacterized protein MELLADRAFT_113456 [Melampsora larici-populina 98AG31]|uniref:Uncharacterized protein n=1 Tax=Melampsora larici-populina (strain 98AG31 / pathotype 3-4-7) TaxID=747676 RepID=F4S9X4_MELLP|nr:uncharacterized protein MELLADRAFT_113456 [Melampsora larici-populina 98AG31]EGF98555.1 hypothetical protein MELLADRAFT_113456 [Melampsora larici-populina 98AG31]
MPTRSGLQRLPVTTPHSESDSDTDSTYKAINPTTKRNRTATTARRGRAGRGQGGKVPSTSNRPTKRPRQAEATLTPEELELDTPSDSQTPTLINYRQLGLQWGRSVAEQNLASLDLPKNNRPSTNGLFKAQALQSQYDLDKTMLCIVLKCSRKVLDEALVSPRLEGPLAREPNMYTNYQTYGVVATTTAMPPKGVAEGFTERNQIVGHTWSAYEEDEQAIFTPRLFEPLCVATHEAYALTQTPSQLDTTSTSQPPQPQPDVGQPGVAKITKEELEKYVPIFQRLVNLNKVSHDMHDGRLWRHSGKKRTQSLENLLMHEIGKVVRQLHVLKNNFNLHFHLLLACWNPSSPNRRALFQEEHTSSQRWGKLQLKNHLLECFAFEATKAPEHLRAGPKQPRMLTEAAARQAKQRADLAQALNNLISPHLRGGYIGRGDAHPKTPDVRASFAKKEFRGKVFLSFQQTPDALVSDAMLAKGPAALTNDEVAMWLDDINNQRYVVVRMGAPTKVAPPEEDSTPTADQLIDSPTLGEESDGEQVKSTLLGLGGGSQLTCIQLATLMTRGRACQSQANSKRAFRACPACPKGLDDEVPVQTVPDVPVLLPHHQTKPTWPHAPGSLGPQPVEAPRPRSLIKQSIERLNRFGQASLFLPIHPIPYLLSTFDRAILAPGIFPLGRFPEKDSCLCLTKHCPSKSELFDLFLESNNFLSTYRRWSSSVVRRTPFFLVPTGKSFYGRSIPPVVRNPRFKLNVDEVRTLAPYNPADEDLLDYEEAGTSISTSGLRLCLCDVVEHQPNDQRSIAPSTAPASATKNRYAKPAPLKLRTADPFRSQKTSPREPRPVSLLEFQASFGRKGTATQNQYHPQAAPREHPALQTQQLRSAMMIDEVPNLQSAVESQAPPPPPPKGVRRPLTIEETDLLLMHRANYDVWEQAKTQKDRAAFKKATLKGKASHRQLSKLMGFKYLMEHTNSWNPAIWDWNTFELRAKGKPPSSDPHPRRNQTSSRQGNSNGELVIQLIREAGKAVRN